MMMNLMTILVKKVFISSKPTFVYLLCPPLCGPFSIQESAAGGLSYKVKKGEHGITIIAPTPYKKKIEEQKLDPDTKAPSLDKDGKSFA